MPIQDLGEEKVENEETLDTEESIEVDIDVEEEIEKQVEVIKKESPKKIKKIEEEDSSNIQSVFSTFLQKDHQDLSYIDNSDKIVLPTGIRILDAISGGGLGMNFIQLVGNPGSSKSTLAAKMIAQGQKLYGNKFIGAYFDSEQSTTKERLFSLGVNNPKIDPYDTNITVERLIKFVSAMCAFKSKNPELESIPSVIVWDSIVNTLTEKGLKSDNVDSIIGERARVLSFYLPKITDALKKYNICLVGVNQLREKIDMGVFKTANDLKYLGGKDVIPGGRSILFNSFQLFLLKVDKDIDEYGFKGCIIRVKTVKNKLFPPNLTVNLVMSFKSGFSNFWTNYEFLKETKRIKSSAWSCLENYPTKKFRQYQAIEFYKEDPEFRKAWNEALDDAVNKELIQPNIVTPSDDDDE